MNDTMPAHLRLSQMILALWVPQAIHAAAELGIADTLSAGPQRARELAARIGADRDATERLLRALAVLGVLELQGDRFALTEIGRCLETDSPSSRRAWSRLMGGREVWERWGRLVDCVRTGRMAARIDDEGVSASEHFDEMGMDPASAAVFHRAMVEMTRTSAPDIVRAIDLAGARTIVDVGGGSGALLAALLEAHPALRGSVLDLAHAREGALALFAERGLADRASFVAGDFFSEAPPRADVLVIKSVIHDWDDERALRILARCREAMDAQTRLVLIEPPSPDAPSTTSPLAWITAFSDLNMLVNTGGRERTHREYVALLERAELRVARVGDAGFWKTYEAVRARA
ncbi:methyltransferase [Sandaracinus amylolyticus]|uniref:O-methyltransferase n=1 Tax=Sandaracinus amylolyticus TaxID=927083 RepID=A0A0F6VYR9_9BACT|nr:methyltransferase [Sandaracinus amylolyticus]AKF03056.1 O-methyltransferase [Sandaracinus amylolyticus]